MEIKHPRVLIISSYLLLDKTNQTSITMNSYFGSWPKDNIAQIITGQFNVPEKGISTKYRNTFILDNSDIHILRLLLSGKRKAKLQGDEKLPVIPKKMSYTNKIKLSLRTAITKPAELLRYKVSDNLISFINSFSPEIIYTIPSGYRHIQLVQKISSKFKIKVVPHFMDDWPSIIYDYPFTQLQRKFVLHNLKKFLSKVPVCLCISDYMCSEFEKRYRLKSSYSLMNCVDKYHGCSNDKYNNKGVLKIGYFGGLHLQRDDIIKKLSEKLHICIPNKFNIVIHTTEPSWKESSFKFSNLSNITYGGYIENDDMFNIISDYDILLHVESFDKSVIKYTRYSISTKIPEYLSSGIPIFAVGPSNIASIKHLEENKAAIVLTDINNAKIISEKINCLLNDDYIGSVLKNAKKLFLKKHLQENQIIYQLLAELSNK